MEVALNKRTFFGLWILCVLGAWSILPYIFYLEILPPAISIQYLFLLTTVQSMVFFGLACWLSFILLPKTDLSPFNTENFCKGILFPGIAFGLMAGLMIDTFDQTLFQNSLFSEAHPPVWAGALASLYGAVNEEVLLRLFLFTLIYFLFGQMRAVTLINRTVFLWITNIIVAFAFGLGHLPAAFKLATPSSLEIFRVLLLNGIPGLILGWLYWSRGLLSSMIAHFTTDLVIHVLLVYIK